MIVIVDGSPGEEIKGGYVRIGRGAGDLMLILTWRATLASLFFSKKKGLKEQFVIKDTRTGESIRPNSSVNNY